MGHGGEEAIHVRKTTTSTTAAWAGPVRLAMALVVAIAGAAARAGAADPFVVPRASGPIAVDGEVAEAAWQGALTLELKVEVAPGENIPAPVRTLVRLCSDDRTLYAAFIAFDPDPSAIRARYSDRDSSADDDWVGLVLDTFNDDRRSFTFLVNPLGVQSDQIESETGGGGGDEWDAIWDSAGRITADGYQVEMAIPFSSLRFQRVEGDQVWGFDAVRSYPRGVRHHIGMFPRDRSNNCYLCQAVTISGFAGASPGLALELDPTLSASRTEQRQPFPDGGFEEVESSLEPGLTALWGVTPNLNLSAVVNPDFSQVEADAAQLEVNTQFTLFYPEKRPFFLEGVDYFSTPLNLVSTRTLADPIWGVKAAGKVGPAAIGLFSVSDEVTNLLLPGTEGSDTASLDRRSTGSVLRYRRDLGTSSVVGFLATDREAGDYYNRLVSADLDLRFTPEDSVTLQVATSRTRDAAELAPPGAEPPEAVDGRAVDLLAMHSDRSFEYYLSYREVSPGFRSDLGFVPQVGYRHYDVGGLWKVQHDDPRHWYNWMRMWVGYERDEDWDGGLLRAAPGVFVTYHGPLQSSAFAIVYYGDRSYLGVDHPERTFDVEFSFVPFGDLALGLEVAGGDEVDYTQNRPGTRLKLEPAMKLFAGRHLRLDLSHEHEDFEVDVGRLYTADLSELRTVYQLNRRAFVRLILQYAHYDFVPEHYDGPVDEEFKHLLSQLLFSYTVNPQTALYLGYSDNYRTDHQVDLTQVDRTAFVKIGYAWVP